MESTRDVLMRSVTEFFRDPGHLEELTKALVDPGTKFPLRSLEYFVTAYSQKHGVCYAYEDPVSGERRPFHVNVEYKQMLKAHAKTTFDAFRRSKRLVIFDSRGKELETTLAQLNFFRWCIRYNVIEYFRVHTSDITREMKASVAKSGIPGIAASTNPAKPLSNKIMEIRIVFR